MHRGPARAHTPTRTLRWALLGAAAAAALLAGSGVLAGGLTPNGTQPPLTNAILTPGDCTACHADYDGDDHVEPYDTWAGSMMANAARDPLFWAALDVANNDVPGAGDYCLRCHMPSGWLAGRSEPPGGSVDGCGMLGDINGTDNDFEGVTCHLCHRMMENPSPPMGEDSVYFENAQFWIDDADCTTPGTGPCRRGPYDYPMGGDPPPPHQWAFSTYHTTGDLCGNCHNVTSPTETLIDEAGMDTGIPFPIERTFLEWQQSDFAVAGAGFESCQDCHMPQATADPVYACFFESTNRAGEMGIHEFAGGNSWIPAVLAGEYPELGRTDEFNETIAAALDMLQNQSAEIAITAPKDVNPGNDLAVSVRVTNLSGHKLPTGYVEGRRMWLNVQARDGSGTLFWESGAYDAMTAVLTEDAQVKVYEKRQGEWDANGTGECDIVNGSGDHVFHFVLANCVAKDNRIPPLGFTGGSDLETMPVGYSYPETSPGSGVLVNYDDTAYTIPVPFGLTTPVSVTARLYYQTSSKEYIEFLRDEAVDNSFPNDCITRSGVAPTQSRGEYLFEVWEDYGKSPPVEMVMASDMVTLDFDVFADGFESGNTSVWTLTFP